jgi:hypothetical protein
MNILQTGITTDFLKRIELLKVLNNNFFFVLTIFSSY